MCVTTAIYLAHLNPLTNAHVEIINELKSQADVVKVMPVVFIKDGKEVNSRSFPFSFEARKEMVQAVFGDSVDVSKNYSFFAPFSKYMPPLLSPSSWKLRRQILEGISDDYFTYTGDKIEGYMLKMYRLRPRIGKRKNVSASSVKNKLYDAINGIDANWEDDIPPQVVEIIKKNWNVVERFAKTDDLTTRVAGMKFPKEGWSN